MYKKTKVIVTKRFGDKSLENLIGEIIKDKINEVTNKLKNGEITRYNQNKNYLFTNRLEEKVGEIE